MYLLFWAVVRVHVLCSVTLSKTVAIRLLSWSLACTLFRLCFTSKASERNNYKMQYAVLITILHRNDEKLVIVASYLLWQLCCPRKSFCACVIVPSIACAYRVT